MKRKDATPWIKEMKEKVDKASKKLNKARADADVARSRLNAAKLEEEKARKKLREVEEEASSALGKLFFEHWQEYVTYKIWEYFDAPRLPWVKYFKQSRHKPRATVHFSNGMKAVAVQSNGGIVAIKATLPSGVRCFVVGVKDSCRISPDEEELRLTAPYMNEILNKLWELVTHKVHGECNVINLKHFVHNNFDEATLMPIIEVFRQYSEPQSEGKAVIVI